MAELQDKVHEIQQVRPSLGESQASRAIRNGGCAAHSPID